MGSTPLASQVAGHAEFEPTRRRRPRSDGDRDQPDFRLRRLANRNRPADDDYPRA